MTVRPPLILEVRPGEKSNRLQEGSVCKVNFRKIAAATHFICMRAISFPRQTLRPAWNTGYL
uniref:Uncharacterized protein n=1 Tax=Nymphaea colorata TaxID=210225 RepID=A0A5K0XDW6_9MAGN